MRRLFLFFGLTLFWNTPGYTQNVERLNSSHIHEAFMNVEAPVTLLTAIPKEPPPPLRETIPQKPDSRAVWAPGYWEWSMERHEFVWCSGSWRQPPPDHRWIPGSWQKVNGGWVRVKGFWSALPESGLTYISKSPPDPYDENPKNQPDKDNFWMSGYWKYEQNRYVWYSGKWEKLDQNWIYVPPKYVWRPEGYVFVPAFWDWPLDQRGTAYACVAVPEGQQQIVYGPDMIVEPVALIEGCLLYYPDYYYFYYYYWYFHVDWWLGCAWCPPWWGWGEWWWMPWWDHWGLWWWWCHPGFPAPFWLDPWLMNQIFGPPFPLMQAMKNIPPPLIIGPNGVIPPANLLDALEDNRPVFPEDPSRIQEEAGQEVEEGSPKRPSGKKVPHDELEEDAPPAPQTTPLPPSNARPGAQPLIPRTPPATVVTPPKPALPPRPAPEIPPSRPPPTYYPPERPSQPPSYQPQWPPAAPSRPSPPPSQTRPWSPPPTRPPVRPVPPPSRPEITPPSSTPPSYPPQTRPSPPPQYTPQAPNIRPLQPQYTPQTPQIPSSPQQIQPSRPSRTPSQKYY